MGEPDYVETINWENCRLYGSDLLPLFLSVSVAGGGKCKSPALCGAIIQGGKVKIATKDPTHQVYPVPPGETGAKPAS